MKRAGGLPAFEARCCREGRRVPKGHCRECGEPVTGRRRSWCSDACVDRHRLRSDPAAQRHAVLLRDQGRCCLCGRDCEELARVLQPLHRAAQRAFSSVQRLLDDPTMPEPSARSRGDWLPSWEALRRAVVAYHELGLEPDRNGYWTHLHRRTWWDMDHRKPISEGGTHDLENLRTLCIPCHLRESADGAARRAARARRLQAWLEDARGQAARALG